MPNALHDSPMFHQLKPSPVFCKTYLRAWWTVVSRRTTGRLCEQAGRMNLQTHTRPKRCSKAASAVCVPLPGFVQAAWHKTDCPSLCHQCKAYHPDQGLTGALSDWVQHPVRPGVGPAPCSWGCTLPAEGRQCGQPMRELRGLSNLSVVLTTDQVASYGTASIRCVAEP